MRAFLLLALMCLLVAAAPGQKKKKNKEEETQTLQVPRELPSWIGGETRRLKFYVTPLSAKGLLSQQVREALKALGRQAGGEQVLKLRAFVAGSGDLRRVRDLVSETYTEKHQNLPVLSLVRAGGLPMEGAQVVLEAVTLAKKEVNPGGLVFLSGTPATTENPLDPVPPLAAKTLAALRGDVQAAGLEAADVLRVTCFFSSLENLAESRKLVEAEYPRVAADYVQTQRAPVQAAAACEAVARAKGSMPRLRTGGTDGSAAGGLAGFAQVGAKQVVLTGTQSSFGYEEKDARLAMERLAKAVEQAGATMRDVAFTHYYPLSPGIAKQVRKVRADFFDPAHPPAGTMMLFEELPSMDSGFAVDVVAVKD